MYEDSPIYFEAQLSTTFLRVMVERRDFYLRNGGTLYWIFRDFMPESRRLLHDDVFYTNNRNIFIVNDEALHASRTRKVSSCNAVGCRRFGAAIGLPVIGLGLVLFVSEALRAAVAGRRRLSHAVGVRISTYPPPERSGARHP